MAQLNAELQGELRQEAPNNVCVGLGGGVDVGVGLANNVMAEGGSVAVVVGLGGFLAVSWTLIWRC